MLELPRSHNDCVANLFHFRIKLLRPCEDLQNDVHWELLLHCFVFVLDFLLDNQGSADSRVCGCDRTLLKKWGPSPQDQSGDS
jgi:hypothetical protein